MRRSFTSTVLVLAAGALYFVGCTDGTPGPTEPPSFKKGGIPAPQARINGLIKDAFDSKADKNDAHRQMARIKNALARGDVEGGQSLTFDLVEFVQDNADDMDAGEELIEELFAFAGIGGGFVGPAGRNLVTPDQQAAVSIPVNALTEEVLISFFKKEQPCFPTSEIPANEQFDDCYTFLPEGQAFDVEIRVEVCLRLLHTDPFHDDARLHGRDDPGPPVELDPRDHELIECFQHPVASIGSSSIGRFALASLDHLAGFFGPTPLYASTAFRTPALGGARGSFTDIGWALPQDLPDLEITSSEVSPSDPDNTDDLSFIVEVSNNGDGATGSGFDVEITLLSGMCGEGAEIASGTFGIAALSAGASFELLIELGEDLTEGSTLSPDDYCLRSEADPEDDVVEDDEFNNVNELDFTVASSGCCEYD